MPTLIENLLHIQRSDGSEHGLGIDAVLLRAQLFAEGGGVHPRGHEGLLLVVGVGVGIFVAVGGDFCQVDGVGVDVVGGGLGGVGGGLFGGEGRLVGGLGRVGVFGEGDLAVGVFGHVHGVGWPGGLAVMLLLLLLM